MKERNTYQELISDVLVHHCTRRHHHFHLVAGPEMIHVSMPFATFDHGARAFPRLLYQMWHLEMACRCSLRAFLAQPNESFSGRYVSCREEELRVLRQLEELTKLRYRSRGGQFLPGVLLEPSGVRLDWERELNGSRQWPSFVMGRNDVEVLERYEAVVSIRGVVRRTGRFEWFSQRLSCDFIDRPAYSLHGYPKSPRELGIKP